MFSQISGLRLTLCLLLAVTLTACGPAPQDKQPAQGDDPEDKAVAAKDEPKTQPPEDPDPQQAPPDEPPARQVEPPKKVDPPPADPPKDPAEPPKRRLPGEPNRLAKEKSPYLLQHKDNPVDWYPWGPEAFERAKREDKPVFLSIGYSTCHWCHVMEHESFEDEEVAKLMNEAFVCIKVDREERPDIDNIYMQACQVFNQGRGCGWPLNVIMMPDKRPFFAGTYFPRERRGGRPGMLDLVPAYSRAWRDRREDIEHDADLLTGAVRRVTVALPGEAVDRLTLKQCYEQLSSRYDADRGGFASRPRLAPKFPSPHNLTFLLRWHRRTGDEQALAMVEKTLTEMRRGGIFDHVGFGFHRYSTDPEWLLPHFEKMLYDQALLVIAYTEAYQATGKPEYEQTAREILTYVLRDMTSPDGGFYSAEDADSEGEEGKFYVWESEELDKHLTPAEAELYRAVYGFEPEGNFVEEASGEKTGGNIPHRDRPLTATAEELGLEPAELVSQLEAIRRKLFAEREKRVHPYKDDKILCDWNGLMIAAMAKAGRVFDEPQYTTAATRAYAFIDQRMREPSGRLLHRFRGGEAGLMAHVDDYAFLIWGLLELYETSFDVAHLRAALQLNDAMIEHYWDETAGGFYFTADDAEKLLVRQKESYDGAVPSGNSVAMLNLLRLGRITGRAELETKAADIGKAFARNLQQAPSNFTQMMAAVDFASGGSFEVVIVGRRDSLDTREMLAALRKIYLPNKVVLFREADLEAPPISELASFTLRQTARNDAATAYVCQNYSCNLPTNDVAKMLELLTARPKEE